MDRVEHPILEQIQTRTLSLLLIVGSTQLKLVNLSDVHHKLLPPGSWIMRFPIGRCDSRTLRRTDACRIRGPERRESSFGVRTPANSLLTRTRVQVYATYFRLRNISDLCRT